MEWGDGKEADAGWIQWGFSGVSTFAHLKHTKCLTSTDTLFDIAILGVPFDTAVSYRPGMSLPLPAKLISFLFSESFPRRRTTSRPFLFLRVYF